MPSSNSYTTSYEERIQFLNLRTKPGFYVYEQVCYRLNCTKAEVEILVQKKLLKVAGKPAPNAKKRIAGIQVERCAEDLVWLDKAATAIYGYWAQKNIKQKMKSNGTKSSMPPNDREPLDDSIRA